MHGRFSFAKVPYKNWALCHKSTQFIKPTNCCHLAQAIDIIGTDGHIVGTKYHVIHIIDLQ